MRSDTVASAVDARALAMEARRQHALSSVLALHPELRHAIVAASDAGSMTVHINMRDKVVIAYARFEVPNEPDH